MRAVDPWPAAEVLRDLPATAKLSLSFDPAPLIAALRDLEASQWSEIRIITGQGLGTVATRSDWRTIPLRSIGGDPSRGDAGGPDLAEFADTDWLDRLPAYRAVLEALPGPLGSARLMSLGPGAASPVHSDTKMGLPWGRVRLHVPVVVVPEAVLEIDDGVHCWPAGELWYADFTRAHSVHNDGTAIRVHLVVDVMASDDLIALMPEEFGRPAARADYLLHADGPPGREAAAGPEYDFAIPTGFLSWEEPAAEALRAEPLTEVSIVRSAAGLVLAVDDRPHIALVPVGPDRFRYAGWTSERTIQICPEVPAPHVVLEVRQGRDTVELAVPARRRPSSPTGR